MIYTKSPAGLIVALTRTLSEIWTYILTQILPVSSGGTGVGTLAAGGILMGNGTAAIQSALPTTATYVVKAAVVSGSLAWTQDYALTYWQEGISQASPNATVPVAFLTAKLSTATDMDACIGPKGAGAFTVQVADATLTSGAKRGTYAVDFQRTRTAAAMVASGSYSFVGTGSNNTASAANTTIINGTTNTASAANAQVFNGTTNSATGANSQIFNGTTNTAAGVLSSIVNASNSQASGRQSTILSGSYINAKGIEGGILYGNTGNTVLGQSQSGVYSLAVTTVGTVSGRATTNKAAAGAANQIVLANNSVIAFNALISGIDTVNNYAAAFWLQGAAYRGANAAATSVVSSVLLTTIANSFPLLNGVTAGASADTTNGAIGFSVTGYTGSTVNWTITVSIAEVTR